MHCRKNVRKLIQAYQAAAPADRPGTELMRYRQALLALKAAPSVLPAPHTQANRYDDFVYIHQQSMAGHNNADPGPHAGHKGPLFFPWHREFLRQFERALREVSGDASICLPYWDFTQDQAAADPGFPFIDDFLGGDGTGPNDAVQTGVFALANGWTQTLGGSNALQRELAQGVATLPSRAAVTQALAISVFDAEPFNRNVAAADGMRNRIEGWIGPQGGPNVHNRVHVWVGGSMGPATSPNDPVFYLNHVMEDHLWATWMQKHPAVPHYLPDDSYVLPAGHTHLKRLSDTMENLAEYFGAGTLQRPVDLLDHRAITWYDTDLPDVTLESGPALAFNDTPAGLTAAKLIRFRVRSCQTVHFSISGAPSGNFSVFGGPDFSVVPQTANDFETLEIEVRFVGQGAAVQVSAVDITVHITDAEGYFAANPGGDFVVRQFHVELVANNIVTNDSSIVLVLDRSGSMSDVAAGGQTKSTLLKSAVGVLHELMKPGDQIGIARFDHEADVLLPMTPQAAGLGSALSGSGLDPRGATSIGAGILVGSGLINGAGATHPNRAMVVLSDGNENTAPLIGALPAGTINQTTFAIGLGLPGQVSDPVLDQIAANSGGYLLVTGNLATNDERFALAKTFIQILKDATRNQVVTDPPGHLLWNGATQEVPFTLGDSDVSADVVVLCALPLALDFSLRTPGGQLIDATLSGVEPNVRYRTASDVAYYRLMLPALPSQASGSHRGPWTARLALRKPQDVLERIKKLLHDERREAAEWLRRLRAAGREGLPYELSVYAYSNLTMDAQAQQSGYAPGAVVTLDATLWEYKLPLAGNAQVWAEVTLPDGGRLTLALPRTAEGRYRGQLTTSRAGLYRFTVRAEGHSRNNARFSREKRLSAGVWVGGDRPYDPHVEGGSPGCNAWLHCVLEALQDAPELQRLASKLGIDLKRLLHCLRAACDHPRVLPQHVTAAAQDALNDWQRLAAQPGFAQLLASLVPDAPADLHTQPAAATSPVKRRARFEVGNENMFVDPPDKKDHD